MLPFCVDNFYLEYFRKKNQSLGEGQVPASVYSKIINFQLQLCLLRTYETVVVNGVERLKWKTKGDSSDVI